MKITLNMSKGLLCLFKLLVENTLTKSTCITLKLLFSKLKRRKIKFSWNGQLTFGFRWKTVIPFKTQHEKFYTNSFWHEKKIKIYSTGYLTSVSKGNMTTIFCWFVNSIFLQDFFFPVVDPCFDGDTSTHTLAGVWSWNRLWPWELLHHYGILWCSSVVLSSAYSLGPIYSDMTNLFT